MLTAQLAAEIYAHKLKFLSKDEAVYSISGTVRGKSSLMSRLYGVSPRAVRDIWNRRTWGFATNHLWQYDGQILEIDEVHHLIVEVANVFSPRLGFLT